MIPEDNPLNEEIEVSSKNLYKRSMDLEIEVHTHFERN